MSCQGLVGIMPKKPTAKPRSQSLLSWMSCQGTFSQIEGIRARSKRSQSLLSWMSCQGEVWAGEPDEGESVSQSLLSWMSCQGWRTGAK